MKMGIYKITSPSGRVYIGQSNKIEKRINNYKKLKQCNRQIKLYNSFLKYGVELHVFEIIEECNEDMLNIRERYWQDYYDVLNSGLNLRLTGTANRSGKLSNDVRQKISKANTGKKHSLEFKIKCSNRLKGKRMSQEAIDASIKSRLGKKRSKEIINKIKISKRLKSTYLIRQYSLDNTLIKEWSCLAEIQEILGFSKPNIHNCLTNKSKTSNGYKWKKINK